MNTFLRNTILLIAGLGAGTSIAQTEHALQVNVGNTFQLDSYKWATIDKTISVSKKICFANSVSAEAIYWFGENKTIGLGLKPYAGFKQVAFESKIPNTDKDHLADSMSYGNADHFYYHGNELVPQSFTYKTNYWKIGADLSLNIKVSNRICVGASIGFNEMIFQSRNYPEFDMKRIIQFTGLRTVDVITPAKKSTNLSAGMFVSLDCRKRILFQLGYERTGGFYQDYIQFYSKNYTYFLRYNSILLTLKYKLY